MFERTDLPCGPRVISIRLPGARSFTGVVYVRAGSRMEQRTESGIAHFLEHLVFKGTAGFTTTRALSEGIEGVGGTSNAATDRESTTYWARVPGRHAALAVAHLAELVTRPLLRDEDIESERTVIVEEIRSYRDDPGEFIYSLSDEALFGDTPLGWEVAGDEETVKGLDPDAIRGFWSRWYRPEGLVVAVASDLPHEEVVALVGAEFGTGGVDRPSFDPAPALPAGERFRLAHRPGAQAHLCLAVPALRRDHPDQWTLELLDTILGEGMSSRLFLHLREEASLAYDTHSFITDYADCGLLGVYAGVDPAAMPRALDAILAELAALRDEAVPPEEMAKAKAYARGRLELRLEDGRNLATWLGSQEALHERTYTPDEALEAIDAVEADAVRDLAGRLFLDGALTLAAIAPSRRGIRLGERLRLP